MGLIISSDNLIAIRVPSPNIDAHQTESDQTANSRRPGERPDLAFAMLADVSFGGEPTQQPLHRFALVPPRTAE